MKIFPPLKNVKTNPIKPNFKPNYAKTNPIEPNFYTNYAKTNPIKPNSPPFGRVFTQYAEMPISGPSGRGNPLNPKPGRSGVLSLPKDLTKNFKFFLNPP